MTGIPSATGDDPGIGSCVAWSRPFSNGTSVATDDDAFVESACVVGTGTPSDSVAEPGRGACVVKTGTPSVGNWNENPSRDAMAVALDAKSGAVSTSGGGDGASR